MDSSNTYQEQNISNVPVESNSSKSDLVQKIKKSLYKQERDRLWKVTKQVRQSTKQHDFFNNLVKVVQHELKADRVLIYRFTSQSSGEVIAEALLPGWTPALNENIACNCFGGQKALDFKTCGFIATEDPSQLTPYQKQLLEKYQVQASLALPILIDSVSSENDYELSQVWGLIVVQQCEQPRQWQEDEINLLYHLTMELTRVLQSPISTIESHGKQDFIIERQESLHQLMQQTLQEIRQNFKADRTWIYAYNLDGTGEVITESVGDDWQLSGSVFDYDGVLTSENCQSQYVVNDVYNQGFPSCLVASFEAINAKSYIAIPIKSGDRLLGILAVFQNSASRNWRESEVELMHKYSAKISYAVQQVSLIRNSSFQAKQLQKFATEDIVTAVSSHAKQSMEQKLGQIRAFIQADRVLVYGFNPDGSGEIIAESVDSAWTKAANSFDNDCFITPDNCQAKYVANNIHEKDIAPCFIEQIEAFEAKAYIIVPIKSGDRLLGMLGVYQNSGTRNWQESEIQLVMEYAPKFSISLKQTSDLRTLKFNAKQAELISEQDFLTSISQNAEQMMQSWLDKIRGSMKIDRAVVFAFNPDWSGKILAESMGTKWKSAGSILDYDFHFKGGNFEPYYIANNVQTKGLALAVLEKFEAIEAQAYIIVPIHSNNQLMGLLAVYQNSAPRNWQESDIQQLQGYASRFVKPLQQTSYLRNAQFQNQQMEQAFKRERGLSKILEKVRLSKDEKAVWQIATDEGRKVLGVDRVSIYRFNRDWSGNFVADSAAPGWSDLTKIIPFIEDTFLQNTKGGRYKNGESFAVEDIYLQGHKQCHIELLEQMEARAYVLAPIFIADKDMFGSKKLWGLIGCYQNTGARRWQDYEVDSLRTLGLQVGIAMQQINSIAKLQKQSELEKASSKISEQIRKAKDIDEVFKVTTQEVRQAINVDRTVVYQFNPDWSGQVVAESVASGWVSLLVEQTEDEVLSGNRTGSDRCILRKWSTEDIVETDTYLQKTKGSKYFTGKKYTAVDDIYQKKFPDCYIQSLEKYQAKAYIIAPIFQGEKLWGLLGVYQNSGPRDWQELEADQIAQLANQLAIAIQQVDYYDRLRAQSEDLTKTVAREKAAREELQKQALDILKTVRPAFSGDLTVRAKVTETEIGTVAGAYNTTLDSLKGIVEQVQIAALQVTQTTGSSSSAIKGLSVQSERQLEELQQALDRVQAMIDASTVTTENAQKVEIAIKQANQTVMSGDEAMNNTVDSIASIRETVADAGKRVKRLSDSSQKISKVVSLISSFATQTNLLALNAALEATRAGEYGKGFAVVADEVRNLSLQSTEATIEIEKLVKEIQEETQEVAAAMEAGVEQVAEGTNLVNETRESLNEIVIATAEIQGLVQGITSAANVQTQEAASVTRVMGQVAEIANETSQDSSRISVSFEQLEQLAQNLQASVSQFKVK
ncbi:GAF domain-containing protein [Waterburya agarophytonicola K14]|uniref:GAF domain-containing protein n=1 Tax=Waterburya agarophytonicola KI4 TaxID=2874699 RepID=A0A964FHF1_9CYAN|nr:GAF domain-containing protein [Waterburya agarophytonicola]MCC0179111.1 GAF domain-containing protein [Waterburya agarophytonicola KI4]